MPIGVITIHFQFPSNRSLKDKRGQLMPIIHRLRKQFNLSVVELDLQDNWNQAVIACAGISNSREQIYRELQRVSPFIYDHFPNIQILDDKIEII